MANDPQAIINKMTIYGKALNNTKTAYLKHHGDDSKVYDSIFTLDYMIEMNTLIIKYLSFLKNTNNRLAIKTRDDLFASIENISSEDMGTYIDNIKMQINNEKKIFDALATRTWTLTTIAATSFIAIASIPILVYSFLMSAITLQAMAALMVVVAAVTAVNSYLLKQYKPEISDIKKNILSPRNNIKKSYTEKTQIIQLIPITEHIPIEKIKDCFFNHKMSFSRSTINDDVNEEYQRLVLLS